MGTKVRLHICGNIRRILPGMGRLGCEIVDIDSMVPLAEARQEMGPQVVLAGNLDPVKTLRNGTPEAITAAIAECHRQAGPRYIVAAGCEVPRDTPGSADRWIRDLVALLEGRTAAEIEEIAAWVVDEELWPGRREPILDELVDAHAEGARVVIVSGTYEPVLRLFAERVGAEAVGTPSSSRATCSPGVSPVR